MKAKHSRPVTVTAVLPSNTRRMENLSRNRVAWHLQAISWAEKWIMKNVQGLNPASDRIIRFYTYNDQNGQDFEYEIPCYKFDLTSCLYDDFTKVSNEIGQILLDNFGVIGRYFYDIKVSLHYIQADHPTKEEYQMEYSWEFIKTDNPRCVFGNPTYRKDCEYLKSTRSSKLVIDGYFLSGKYNRMVDVLNDLANKTLIVHSKSDVKALLRIMKFMGVSYIMKAGKFYRLRNNSKGFFSKQVFSYQMARVNNQTVMCAVHINQLAAHTDDVLDIDELIVKRTWKAKIRDMRKVG